MIIVTHFDAPRGRSQSILRSHSATFSSAKAPTAQPSYRNHMLCPRQPIIPDSEICCSQPTWAIAHGFVRQAAIATAIRISATPITVLLIQSFTPGFDVSPLFQTLSKADVTFPVDYSKTGNTEKLWFWTHLKTSERFCCLKVAHAVSQRAGRDLRAV